MNTAPEYWMRGPIDEIHGLLQPVAHAFLQMQSELSNVIIPLNNEELWAKPFGMASVGFHVLHIIGVIDRMFTYGDRNSLSEEQFEYLKRESETHIDMGSNELKESLESTVKRALEKLKSTDIEQLTHTRHLGRKQIPVSLIGLLFHAAEHSMRHLGQALVTARVLINNRK